ncbi:MAG: class I SAM-dependent methyltransferase [Spirochaetota bacterium]
MIRQYFIKIMTNSLQLSQLPGFIRKNIDPDTYKRELFVRLCANETKKNGIVLDAGAGECQYKKYFTNHKYIGTDLAIGQDSWNYNNLDVISNLEKLPFKNCTFDSILCLQVLEHVKEPQNVCNELYRVLKVNGNLYLSIPQGWCVHHQAPNDYYRFTNYGIKYILEKSKFTIDFIKPTTGYFGYLANRLIFFPKIVFWKIKNKTIRCLLLPLELISYFIFVILLPLILNICDRFDADKDFTLNYLIKAHKNVNQ